MMKKLFTTIAVAGAMATTPALAQEATFDRMPAPVEEGEQLEGRAGVIIGILAAIVVIAGIIVATGEDNADEQLPTSP